MSQTPEGKVKADIKKWLAQIGAWYFMPVKQRYGRVGIPDFIVCWEGKFIAIEAKRPGNLGGTTPLQRNELFAITQAGGIALVIDNVEQLKEYFNANQS